MKVTVKTLAASGAILAATLLGGLVADEAMAPDSHFDIASLEGKNYKERADMKAEVVASFPTGEFTEVDSGIKVDIQKVTKIEGGVEIYARAWQGSQQLGFSSDGSVDIERFRIFNPPLLVEDPAGDIVREYTDPEGKVTTLRYRQDPEAAIQESLAHTISLIAKKNNKIVPGKTGKTTDTFYPSLDGFVMRDSAGATWSDIRGGAGTFSAYTGTNEVDIYLNSQPSTLYQQMQRALTYFDTSAIADNVVISAAVLSGKGVGKNDTRSQSIGITSGTSASDSALADADYAVANFGSTRFATDITIASWSTSAYNDFTLNASGLAAISKTGISKFAWRFSGDIDNVDPGGGVSILTYARAASAEAAGTTTDPTLVVTYSTPSTFKPVIIIKALEKMFPTAYAHGF